MMSGRVSAARRRSRMGSDRRSTGLTIFMLAFVAYFLLPLGWLIIASTKSVNGLFSSFGLWFANDGFNLVGNIRDVFTYDDGVYVHWLVNTILYAVVSAVGATIIATFAGYGFAKYKFAGKQVLFGVMLASVMIPTTALTLPTYLIFSQFGLVNSPLAFILPSLLSPFGVFLMRIYAADAVDDSLIEAARIDGAGDLRIFFRVSAPLLAPGFVTVLLFSLVATWNNYFLPYVMFSDSRLYPLTVGLAAWNSQGSSAGGGTPLFNLVITGSLIAIIPMIAAFLYLQKYWTSGLSAGGTKQ
jgi:multiple sugar transport system permease protein